MTAAAAPLDKEARLLERLGTARDLDALLGILRARGIRIGVDQRLRAEFFLRRLSATGIDLSDAATLANWLAPILATSVEMEREIRAALVQVAPAETIQKDRREAKPYTWDLLRQEMRARGVLYLSLALLTLAGIVFAVLLLRDAVTEPAPTITSGCPDCPVIEGKPVAPDVDAVVPARAAESMSHFLLLHLMPVLFVLIPGGCLIYALLWPRTARDAVLRRSSGVGRRFESLSVPPAADCLFVGRDSRRAAIGLKSPDLLGGLKLDTPATISTTIRHGGLPSLRWRQEARIHEYLMICERGGSADHMAIIADALCRQLDAVDVAYTRYDLDVGADNVRHSAGRRSGPRVDSLAQVRQRYAGARLILLGGGESLARRFARNSVLLETLIRDLEAPLLLNTTPRDGWGWREAWLQSHGIELFTADEDGLEAASAWLRGNADERERFAGARPDLGEDSFLTTLESDQIRLLSNTPPAEREQAYLVRRLRSLVGAGDGFRLLVAIAAFPRTHPSITRHLSLMINDRSLTADLACRLSRLPWLRNGRFPDWLRTALLRSLSAADREHLRGRLKLVLDEFRTYSARRETAGLQAAGERLDILDRPGVVARLLAQLGLGDGLISGEGIFIRFLEGEISDLDQPIARVAPPPTWQRIGAAALAGVIALVVSVLLSRFATPLAAVGSSWWEIETAGATAGIFLFACYAWISWRLWLARRTGRAPTFGVRTLLIAAHGFAFFLLLSVTGYIAEQEATMLAPMVLIALLLLPIHFAAEWRGWRGAPAERKPLPPVHPIAGAAWCGIAGMIASVTLFWTFRDQGGSEAAILQIFLIFTALVLWPSLIFYPIKPASHAEIGRSAYRMLERFVVTFLLLFFVTCAVLPVGALLGFEMSNLATVALICGPLLTVALMIDMRLLPSALANLATITVLVFAGWFDPDYGSIFAGDIGDVLIPTAAAAMSYFAVPAWASMRRFLSRLRTKAGAEPRRALA